MSILETQIQGFKVITWLIGLGAVTLIVVGLGLLYLYTREKRRINEAVRDLSAEVVDDERRRERAAVREQVDDTVEAVRMYLDEYGDGIGDKLEAAIAGEIDELEDSVESELGDQEETSPGHAVRLDPPDVGNSIWGLFKLARHRAKAKRLAKRGYIKWYRIGSRMDRPTWVKPKYQGEGEPEVYESDEGVTYLFPQDAMVTDGGTGAWVAAHRENEVEPINLRKPAYPPLDADRLEEVINMKAESEKPGLLDRLNITRAQMMWAMLGLAFVGFAAYRYMG